MISPQFCEGGPDADFVPLCPEGWVDHLGKCYKVFDELKNWQEAEDTCNVHQVREGYKVRKIKKMTEILH